MTRETEYEIHGTPEGKFNVIVVIYDPSKPRSAANRKYHPVGPANLDKLSGAQLLATEHAGHDLSWDHDSPESWKGKV